MMMKEVGDWVKYQTTIWYLNFFMTQYDIQDGLNILKSLEKLFCK